MALVWRPSWTTCRCPQRSSRRSKRPGPRKSRRAAIRYGAENSGSETDTVAIIDPRHAAKQLIYERIFRALTLGAAVLVLLILGGVAISLARGAWPAISHFGFSFVTREIWNPVTDEYGALAPIYGTVVTSLIAMLLAVPGGCCISPFLINLCSPLLELPSGVAGEFLASVACVIFAI